MGNSKIQILIIFILASIASFLAITYINIRYKVPDVSMPKFSHKIVPPSNTPITASLSSSTTTSTLPPLPSTLFLPVPFTPQAPTANWDELHNEACEEANAIMTASYFASSTDINLAPSYVETEISKLTKWQDEHYGYYLDTTSDETAQMIQQVYGLQTKLIENFSDDDIKTELAQNHLVIISENGRLLKNPFYKQPGPIHHMLLIKGYDGETFITNDSGTKRGQSYAYDFPTIYNAAADWNHETKTVDETKKIAIIVWK